MGEFVSSWPVFVLAVVILCFPPFLIIGKRAKRSLSHQRDAGPFGLMGAILAWQNWFDLIRGFAGAWILFHHAIEAPEPDLKGKEMLFQGAVLAIALGAQTIQRYRGRTFYLAPVFYVWGLTIFLIGPVTEIPVAALYGIAIAIVIARVVNDVEWHLPALAAATGAIAYFLHGLNRELIIAGALIILPVLLTFLGKGKMVFLMRTRATGAEE